MERLALEEIEQGSASFYLRFRFRFPPSIQGFGWVRISRIPAVFSTKTFSGFRRSRGGHAQHRVLASVLDAPEACQTGAPGRDRTAISIVMTGLLLRGDFGEREAVWTHLSLDLNRA